MILLSCRIGEDNNLEDYYTAEIKCSNTNYLPLGLPGYYQRSPFISLAPNYYRPDIIIGHDINNMRTGIRIEDLKTHLLITGVTGTGKTTTVKNILRGLAQKNIPFTVIDLEGEYRDLESETGARYFDLSNLRINLFGDPYAGRSYEMYVAETIIQSLYEIGVETSPQMDYVIYESVRRCNRRGKGLKCIINNMGKVASRLQSGWKTAEALRVRFWSIEDIAYIFEGRETFTNPLRHNNIIDLSQINKSSKTATRFIVNEIILVLRRHIKNLPMSDKVRHVIVIEEAENIVPKDKKYITPNLVQDIMRNRKNGGSIIVVSHSPSLIHPDIIKSIGSIMVFRLNDYNDKRVAASALGHIKLEDYIGSLGNFEVIFRPSSTASPFYIRIAPNKKTGRACLQLLNLLRIHPGLPQRELREKLGVSGKEFKRCRESLEEENIVRRTKIYTGCPGRSPVILELVGENPSGQHEFMVHKIYHEVSLICRGKNAMIRKQYKGPDLLLRTRNRNIGIEVETGTNISISKYKNFIKDLDYLLIVCTKRRVCSRIERMIRGLDQIWVISLCNLLSEIRRFCNKI